MLRALPVVIAIAAFTLPATAQTLTGDREREGAPHRIQAEGTLAGWRVRADGDPFAPPRWQDAFGGGIGVYARIRLTDDLPPEPPGPSDPDPAADRVVVLADLDLGARAFVGGGAFRLGNLYVGASGGARAATWTVRGGGGLGLPIASAFPAEVVEGTVVTQSLFAHGAWDAWLVLPDVLPIVVRGDAAYDLGPFFAGVEIGASLMPFIPARVEAGPAYFAAQLAAWAGGRIEDLVALGLRGQVVALVQYDGPTGFGAPRYEEGFAALVPFVRLELRRWSFEARGTIHLDDPLGVFGEGPRNWSLRVQFGYTL